MEPYLGQVELFAFDFAPTGWMACEGQILQVQSNMELFSLIGSRYGGDGRDSFGLPDLRGKSPVSGMGYYIAVQGQYPPRA